MLKFRAISFPLLFLLLWLMIFWEQGIYIFMVAVPLIFGMLVYEVLNMSKQIKLKSFPKSAAWLTVGLILAGEIGAQFWLTTPFMTYWFLAFFCVPLAGMGGLLFVKDKADYIQRFFTSAGVVALLILIYGPMLVIYFGWVNNIRGWTFLYFILVTKMMDTGGYIFGMLSNRLMKNGNHKICPSVSPKKSYEGALGGILMSLGAAWLFQYFGHAPFDGIMNYFVALLLAFGSFAGDLTESAFKRACNVKDSGGIIPGMGGVFDVFDSFIYNNVLFMFLLIAL